MTEAATQRARTSGVLLHPTALPDSPVCGTFGEPSRRWLHQLANSGIGVWQMLPLSPPDPTGSPYSSPSCFALNAWLLDASDLANEQFISHEALNGLPGASVTAAEATMLDFQLANQRSDAANNPGSTTTCRSAFCMPNTTTHGGPGQSHWPSINVEHSKPGQRTIKQR
jgi:4-alpha-glucanotransferase